MVRFRAELAFLLTFATPALAEGSMDTIFPSDGSCYLRHYNEAHMSSHPDQLVTEIAIGPYGPRYASGSLLRVKVVASDRGSDDFFKSFADCEDGGQILFCVMHNGAGSISLTPEKGGKTMLSPTQSGMALEGPSGIITLSGISGDDRDFLLPPVPADSCP